MRLHHILIFIGICLFSVSCYDDYELSNETIIIPEEDTYYDGELVGKIIDEFSSPLTGMDIIYAGNAYTTGKEGLFYFDANRILHQGELLSINTLNGFTYYHTTFPSQNDIHYSTARCYTRLSQATSSSINFNAQLDNELTISSDAVEFNLDVSNYTDDVNVEGYYLNLQEEENLLFFPDALTTEIATPYLNKLDGVHFQWSTTNSERLELASGHSASVQLSTSTYSPDAFVWYFNPDIAKWEKQAKPTYENGKLIFNVMSDGYYCIGTAHQAVHVDGHVVSQLKAVPNAQIDMRNRNGKLINRTFSSQTGVWHATIPFHENHTISVVSYCGDPMAHMDINPSNLTGDDITINVENLPTFIGAIKSCDNQLVEQSILFTDDGHFLYLKDGQFNTALPICDKEAITLSAYSMPSQSESAQLIWRPLLQNNVQSLFICDLPKDNYIALRADGIMRYYEMTTSEIGPDNRIIITAADLNDPDFIFELKMPQQDPGAVPLESLNIQFSDTNLGNDGYASACVSTNADCGFEQFDINHIGGSSGDWITGDFSAKFWMRTTNLMPNRAYNNRTIEGEFRIKRNY